MDDDENLITQSQKTYFEIGLVCVGFTIICGNGFVLATMYRYIPTISKDLCTFIDFAVLKRHI